MERQPLDHRGSGPLAPPPGVVAPGGEPSLRPTAPVQHCDLRRLRLSSTHLHRLRPLPSTHLRRLRPLPNTHPGRLRPPSTRLATPLPRMAHRALRPYPRPRRLLPLARRRAPRLMLGPFRLYHPRV